MERKVAYLYNEAITKFQFSKEHPMKTKRIKMVNSLIESYGIDKNLEKYQSKEATAEQLMEFHHPHYVKYLQCWVNPDLSKHFNRFDCLPDYMLARQDPRMHSYFKINENNDNPGFEGLYNFCQLAAGSSIDAADLILTGQADIVLNWTGGFHHGKKAQASGFCYINDIVLCILELLKIYPRVLYLDIDVHHGDGVQEAFYHTNRVMTVSFHEYAEGFFPQTGKLEQIGEGIGKFFSVNVPLKEGVDDATYLYMFKIIMRAIMDSYRPDVLVLQCGADSLSKDRLGHLNLSIKGHAQAIEFMKSFGVPLILLGGGGYTIQNVSRCWAYETGKMLNTQISDSIPQSDKFYNFYEKDKGKIHFEIEKRPNFMTNECINQTIYAVLSNLKESEIRPSVGFHLAPKLFIEGQEIDCQIISDEEDSMKGEDSHMRLKKI